jgi:hypothetical protein
MASGLQTGPSTLLPNAQFFAAIYGSMGATVLTKVKEIIGPKQQFANMNQQCEPMAQSRVCQPPF